MGTLLGNYYVGSVVTVTGTVMRVQYWALLWEHFSCHYYGGALLLTLLSPLGLSLWEYFLLLWDHIGWLCGGGTLVAVMGVLARKYGGIVLYENFL